MDTIDRFLEELTALTRKYNITIDGCGCCGSPYLEESDGTTHDYLRYSDITHTYHVDKSLVEELKF